VTIEHNVICFVYSAAGCPTLAINNFWEFLIENNIYFAIILWIVALF
jgi:hypothetical protein